MLFPVYFFFYSIRVFLEENDHLLDFFFLHFPRIASRHTEICNIQINPVDGDDSIRIKFCLFKTETLQTELPSNESPCKDSQKLTPTGNSRLQPGLGINALIIPRVELMLSQTQTST